MSKILIIACVLSFIVLFYAALRGKIDERKLNISAAVLTLVFTTCILISDFFKSPPANIAYNPSIAVHETIGKSLQNDQNPKSANLTSDNATLITDGADVLVPLAVLSTIPGFDPDKEVSVAYEKDGVLTITRANKKIKQAQIMEREADGKWWRAKGFSGTTIYPFQLKQQNINNLFSEDNISWARIPDPTNKFQDLNNSKKEYVESDHLIVESHTHCPVNPTADGYDVIIPDALVQAIPGYDPSQPVYAACDLNGWFVRGNQWASEEMKERTRLRKKNGCWVAPGVKGARFDVVQLTSNGEPIWAKIELAFPLDNPFIDRSDPNGMVILVK